MSNITLIVIPGPGARSVSITEGMTVSDLVSQESLHGRDIIVNGSGVPVSEYNQTSLSSGMEIFATGSVKGNSKS
jgi:sulfur carrier protein ThiS